LVQRGLARSRGHARELILEGRVVVDGRAATKPSVDVAPDTAIDVEGEHTLWVNRGAHKLVAALDLWPIATSGRAALDVGASTGGFTQVLLARDIASVVALDVGHGQLHPDVAGDDRVDNREGTSIRDLTPSDVPPIDLVVTDLSFISLRLALPPMAAVLAPGADLVLLVKPQFEVGRQRLGKNGIVTEPGHRADALREVVAAAIGVGLHPHGVAQSPIRGTHGNIEYLLWLRSDPSAKMDPAAVEARIAELTTDAPDPGETTGPGG
jgi:23S rRNA (cytidine1920-2'-O)/16S rRNA (cytidine1409-2'-O)-methyltransferase